MTLDDTVTEELDDRSDGEDENMGLDDLAFDLGEIIPDKVTKTKKGTKRNPASLPSSELDKDKLLHLYVQQQKQQNTFNKKLLDQIATQNKVIETMVRIK